MKVYDEYEGKDNFFVCTEVLGRYSNVRGRFATYKDARTLQDELAQMGEASQMYERRTIFEPRSWTDKARNR